LIPPVIAEVNWWQSQSAYIQIINEVRTVDAIPVRLSKKSFSARRHRLRIGEIVWSENPGRRKHKIRRLFKLVAMDHADLDGSRFSTMIVSG
jgi:hypothetical protein